MNRSIIVAALIISGAILLNGYLDRATSPLPWHRDGGKRGSSSRDETIAILPFSYAGPDSNAALAEDISSGVRDAIAKAGPDLKIVPPALPMPHQSVPPKYDVRKIGEDLKVAHIVTGHAKRMGDRIQIMVQLIDTKTTYMLWAQSYDREATDLAGVENEIAAEVVRLLHDTKG